MTALVVLAGSLAELIPMPVIGGLVLVIGAELVHGRWADIKLVLRTAPLSAIAMLVTFVATTELPLHQAILIGAITSLVLYCVKPSQSATLVALTPTGDRDWEIGEVPESEKVLERGGITELLGPDGVVPANVRVFGALDEALDRGRRWIADRSDTPDGGVSDPRD